MLAPMTADDVDRSERAADYLYALHLARDARRLRRVPVETLLGAAAMLAKAFTAAMDNAGTAQQRRAAAATLDRAGRAIAGELRRRGALGAAD